MRRGLRQAVALQHGGRPGSSAGMLSEKILLARLAEDRANQFVRPVVIDWTKCPAHDPAFRERLKAIVTSKARRYGQG